MENTQFYSNVHISHAVVLILKQIVNIKDFLIKIEYYFLLSIVCFIF